MRKSQMSVDSGVMVVEATNSRQETGEDREYHFLHSRRRRREVAWGWNVGGAGTTQ